MLASEIRGALSRMTAEERRHLLVQCDDETAGSIIAAPAFLSGLSDAEKTSFRWNSGSADFPSNSIVFIGSGRQSKPPSARQPF